MLYFHILKKQKCSNLIFLKRNKCFVDCIVKIPFNDLCLVSCWKALEYLVVAIMVYSCSYYADKSEIIILLKIILNFRVLEHAHLQMKCKYKSETNTY